MNALLHSMANNVDRRCYRRVNLAPGEAEIVLSQSASWMPDERLSVLNLSPEGVAVLVDATLLWPDQGAPVSFRAPALDIASPAYAAHKTTGPNGPSVLGLRLDLEETDRHTVAAFYHVRRFPTLARRGAVPAAEVCELLDRSGYLGLKKDIVPSDEWLAAPWPDVLTREAVYRASDGTVLGHVSVTRAYRRTWLGHEIATLRTHPEAMECRRALYHHFASWPRLLDGGQAMLLGYYNRDRPWHQRFFEEFAQAASPAECVILPVERFAAAPLDPATAVRRWITQAEIGEPDQHELGVVVGIIKRSWPPLALTAFDIDEEHLQSSCLHWAYAETGLARSRTVLVLRERQKVLGVALCESTNSRLS